MVNMFLKQQSNKSFAARSEGGFSLMEVAIALAVIGVLAAPFINQYNIYQENKIRTESKDNLSVVRSALQKYAVNNGRYPLPSDKNMVTGVPGYGEESITPITACTLNSATICRTTTGSLGSAPVLVGTVPFAAIGISEQYTFDGYKRKFTYAVTQALTVQGTFTDNGGVIRLLDNDNTDGDHLGTTNNLQFIIVSHGPNGKGSSTIDGAMPFPCTNTGAGNDEENCNNDAVFNSNYAWVGPPGNQIYSRLEFGVDGATYFDDYVEYATSTTSDIWTLNANAVNADVYKRSTNGNIRIGSWGTTGLITGSTRAPDARVDVAGEPTSPGHVRAQKLLTNRLCTVTENAGGAPYIGCVAPAASGNPKGKVFAPSIIQGTPSASQTTGDGISCSGITGTIAMTGIRNADELCGYNYIPPATITVDASCSGIASGQKIIGGVLYCGT